MVNNINHLKLMQIEVFLLSAEFCSISEASRKMFISQAAASRMIQDFEYSINLPLFDRTNKGVELTPKGQELYQQLKPLYSQIKIVFINSGNTDRCN